MISGGQKPSIHRGCPLLIATSGIIASGKSTVARIVSAELRAVLHIADGIRDEILYSAKPSIEEAWTRSSAEGFTDEVYNEMFRRTRRSLREGRAVVVDGCFGTRALRDALREIANEYRAEFLFIECRCDREVIERRLAERSQSAGMDPSGWLHLLDRFEENWQPVEELDAEQHLLIDTGRPFEETWMVLTRRLEKIVKTFSPDVADIAMRSPEMRRGV